MSPTSGAAGERTTYDALAWFLNISTSVLIVFVNKVLMDPRRGYGFTFGATACEDVHCSVSSQSNSKAALQCAAVLVSAVALATLLPPHHHPNLRFFSAARSVHYAATTLCAFHFLSAAVSMRAAEALGWTEAAELPFAGVRCATATGCVTLLPAGGQAWQCSPLRLVPLQLLWRRHSQRLPLCALPVSCLPPPHTRTTTCAHA